MLPRLTPLQWLVVVFGLAFYGFTVFALTRDYYLRHPPRPSQAAQAETAVDPHALGSRMREALGASDDDISALIESVTEPEVLNTEADRLFQARRYQDAIRLYRRALELDPASVDATNDLGLALHYAGDTQAGLATLREGAAKAPEHQRIQLTLGFIALQAGDADTARAALTRAQDLAPDSDIGREAGRLLGILSERSKASGEQ